MQNLFGLGSIWLQLAAALLIGALLVREQRQMQFLFVASAIAAVLHSFLGDGSRDGQGWAFVFLAVATVRLVMSLARARSGITSADQRELLANVLEVQEPSQQRKLLDLMSWRDADPGDVLMTQGQKEPPLIYVASGAAKVEHDGQIVGECSEGEFLGEMSLITGEKASASVKEIC